MINEKKCSGCKITKGLDLFYNNKVVKDGKAVWCKKCHNEYSKKYRQTEKGKKIMGECGKRHRQTEKGKATAKRNRQSEKGKVTIKRFDQSEKGKATAKRARQSEKGKATAKRARQSDKGKASVKRHSQTDKFKATQKRHRQSDKGKASAKKYRQSDKGKASAKKHRQSDKGKEWYRKQTVEHTQYAIENILRTHVRHGLNSTDTGKTMSCEKLGVYPHAIAKHLGPHPNTLGIKGEFHIHHIYPLSKFDLKNLEHIKVAFDPLNHCWLSAKENLKRNNKLPKRSEVLKTLLTKLNRIELELY